MLISVNNCEYQDSGKKRVYSLTNKSVVIEHPDYPGKSRFRFYDSRGYQINKAASKQEMKAAIERYKTKWGLAK